LIRLTLREHFLAHWLLWRSYPDYLPLASAFLQMNNKNPKVDHKKFQGRINSRTYHKLKTAVYDKLSELNTDKVRLKDKHGNNIILTKEEYANQKDLVFHTTGKISVFDKESNSYVYIPTSEYHSNKTRYITRLHESAGNKAGNPAANPAAYLFHFRDIDSGCIVRMQKSKAKNLNNSAGYKKYKQIIKHQISCVDENGEIFNVSLDDYRSNDQLKHANQNKLPVFDIDENAHKSITLEEYNLNKSRYKTSTKGKVLAKDSNGNTMLISKEEFQTGNYVGITQGLRTVFDKESHSYIQISKQEFLENRKKYTGPNQGKVNVIDKLTGERKQIDKLDFDLNRYSGLGNKKFLFKCKNILTDKEKYISIYEWHLMKDQYEIIDYEKYLRAVKDK
jgi:hypothetical protein